MSNISAPNMDERVFVTWKPEDTEPSRKSAPRAHHKKSRAGCQQCRNRRVKCDEEHPMCGNCQRHQSSCDWGRSPGSQSSTVISSSTNTTQSYDIRTRPLSLSGSSHRSPRQPEIESKSRRLSELKLLHHYMISTSSTFNLPHSKYQIWDTLIPHVAFKHDSLLYSIYAVTSLHLSHLQPNDTNHFEKYQEYLGLCLREHRDNVANLDADNADAAMLTATLFRICSIAVLQIRDLEEEGKYIPPVEWLIMNFGTGHGLGVAAWEFLIHDENSVMRKMIGNDTPGLDPSSRWLRDDKVFARSNILPALSGLRHRTVKHEAEEAWDEDIRNAYEHTLAYIGFCQRAIDAGEPERSILRRLVLFPTVVERKFITLVEEREARALVMLAHYFSFWRRFEDFWWCGKVGDREVRAITESVDIQWKVLLPGVVGNETPGCGLTVGEDE